MRLVTRVTSCMHRRCGVIPDFACLLRWLSGEGVRLQTRNKSPASAAFFFFYEGEKHKHWCIMILVHIKNPQVVQINLEPLIINSPGVASERKPSFFCPTLPRHHHTKIVKKPPY